MPWSSLDPPAKVLAQARFKITAAKQKHHLSWERIFKELDKDGNGQIDRREMMTHFRPVMGIHDNVLTDYEIKMLFDHLDSDNSGGVELTEMLEFLQTGEKNASEEQAREGKRLHSLQHSLHHILSKHDKDPRKDKLGRSGLDRLFAEIDTDNDGKIDFLQFVDFVRIKCGISPWAAKSNDLRKLYLIIDADDDGVEKEELFNFIYDEKNRQPLTRARTLAELREKVRPTYKEVLRNKTKNMTNNFSADALHQVTHAFTNVGRVKPPIRRE
jgi:Ca2+-binding EF-hand superfamily protein